MNPLELEIEIHKAQDELKEMRETIARSKPDHKFLPMIEHVESVVVAMFNRNIELSTENRALGKSLANIKQ